MKLVHWLLMGGLLHLVQRGGDWVGRRFVLPDICITINYYSCTVCNLSKSSVGGSVESGDGVLGEGAVSPLPS